MEDNRKDPNDDFDPFGDIPDGGGDTPPSPHNEEKADGKRGKKRRKKLPLSRRIAYSAVATALAVVMMVLTCYLPVTVAPLVMISLCYNIVADRCGVGYAVMTVLASVGLGFLACAANIGILLIVAVVFVPYSLLCYVMGRLGLTYDGVRRSVIRALIMAVFAALCVLFVYLLGGLVANIVDIGELISSLGSAGVGYTVVTLVAVLIFVCIDLIFVRLGGRIVDKI